MRRDLRAGLFVVFLFLSGAPVAIGWSDFDVPRLIERGALLENRGVLDQALRAYQDASRVMDERFGSSDPRRLTNLNNIARVFLLLGQTTDAAHTYQTVLASADGDSRKSIPFAIAEFNFPAILINDNRQAPALDLFQASVADWKTLLESGRTRLEAAIELNGLLHLEHSQDLYRTVEPIYQMRLSILETAFGKINPHVGRALIDLAIVNRDLGRASEAEAFYYRAIEISRRVPLGQNQDLATASINLAGLLGEQRRDRESLALYDEIIERLRATGGPPGVYLALALHGLGVGLSDREEYVKAIPNLNEAASIWQQLRHDASLAQGLHDLGVALSGNRQFPEAEHCFNRSIGITTGRLGTRSVALVPLYGSLGVCYCNWGDYVRAEQAFLTARDIASGMPGEAEPSGTGPVDVQAGRCLYKQGRYVEAETRFHDALRESPQPQTPAQLEDYAEILYLLGLVCSAEQKLTPAERFQKRSLSIREQLCGPESPKLIQNLQNLSWIYECARRDEEAKQTNERILRLRVGSNSNTPCSECLTR
jgi:tetratricopeptide (TPR) repeat protein